MARHSHDEPAEQVSEHEPVVTGEVLEQTHMYFAEPFATVISGALRERMRQATEKGYNAEHDSQHSLEEWAQLFGQHYREALRLAKTGNVELFRNEVNQGLALYMACMEALTANLAGEYTTKEAARKEPKRAEG